MGHKTTKRTTKSDGTVTLKAVPQPVASGTPATVQVQQVGQGAVPVTTKQMIKKPEFLDNAIARTAIKKRDAKPAIEAALAELAALLADGNELNLPPLGKLKVVKSKAIGEGAVVMTLKLRTMKDGAREAKADTTADDDD